MMRIKAVNKYLFDKSLSRFLCASLISCINGSLFSKTVHKETTIAYLKDELDESFNNCVIAALDLIEDINPKLSHLVSRNLKYIVGERPKSKKWLAKYHRSLEGCVMNWDEFEMYKGVVRSQIMAGAIVHEAYHGECYRVFGFKAYETEPFENICRRRETRILNRFISIRHHSKNPELKRRIAVLQS